VTFRKAVIKRIAVIKFRLDDGNGNSRGSFRVKVRTDRTKLTKMIVT